MELRKLLAEKGITNIVQAEHTKFHIVDSVTSDFYKGAECYVTRVYEDQGFDYRLKKPHSLGPRHGFIDQGTAYSDEFWRPYDPRTDMSDY